MSVDILFKGIDERQGITHASGTIGGFWVFTHGGMKEVVHRIRCVYSWFASYELSWRVSIPQGCDSGNGLKIIALARERLTEVYPEG